MIEKIIKLVFGSFEMSTGAILLAVPELYEAFRQYGAKITVKIFFAADLFFMVVILLIWGGASLLSSVSNGENWGNTTDKKKKGGDE